MMKKEQHTQETKDKISQSMKSFHGGKKVKISQFTVRILGIWLISLVGVLILKTSSIFVAPVITTLILAILEGIKNAQTTNLQK